MPFNDEEKARIKHFLSYPDWSSTAASIQMGYPAASQVAFLVDDSFHRLTPGGELSVRRNLCECESIERQMSAARARFKAAKLGKLEHNQRETDNLRDELKYWVQRLASDLGVQTNPYSKFENEGQGGVNARVM